MACIVACIVVQLIVVRRVGRLGKSHQVAKAWGGNLATQVATQAPNPWPTQTNSAWVGNPSQSL